jgi:glycosyltransferase involved in cell wall biosynthesis
MESDFAWRTALQRTNADVALFVSPPLIASLLHSLRPFRRKPVVVWVQDIYALGILETGAASKPTAKLVHRLERRALMSADHVIVIHEWFRSLLLENYKIEPDALHVLRNWNHSSGMAKSEAPQFSTVSQAEAREALGWPQDVLLVLHAGNMGAKQGLESVVDAARLVDEEDRKMCFVLLGDGNQRRILEHYATGVESIIFCDPIPNEKFELALIAADILLLNERPEVQSMALPSKLTTYFRSDKPVVAAVNASGITAREVELAGGGIVVTPGSPRDLVTAIEVLASDKAKMVELSAAGQVFGNEFHRRDVAIHTMSQILDAIVDSDKGKHANLIR